MRKYELKPMSSMTLSSYARRSTAASGNCPALAGALEGQVPQVLAVGGEALGQREVGQLRLAEVDLDVAALGDPRRVVTRLGLAEQRAHLGRGLEVVLVAVELEAVGIAHQRPRLHAQQRVLGDGVVAVDVVAVVVASSGAPMRRARSSSCGLVLCCSGMPSVLQLDEEVVLAEDVLQAGGLGGGALDVPLHERLQHVPAQAAGGGDEPAGVVGQRLQSTRGL